MFTIRPAGVNAARGLALPTRHLYSVTYHYFVTYLVTYHKAEWSGAELLLESKELASL
jgi:hypothetical protein